MSRKKIAVLLASIDREYQQDFARGLSAAGSQYDADICIFNSQGHMNVAISTSEKEERMIYDLPDLSMFDGVISLTATMGNVETFQKVIDVLKPLKGKPHVSVDVPLDGAVTIGFDDAVCVREVTEHLIQRHGARRFAFVSGPLNHSVSQERVRACRQALAENGLYLDDGMIFDGQWTRVGGRNAAEQILNLGGELPDAIVCSNDDMALSVIDYFAERGIRVPGDVAVTGFDALREAVMRGLTTICRPVDRCARLAIDILCKWIDGKEPDTYHILLPTIPIYGESCGCEQSLEYMSDKLRMLGADRWDMETVLTRVSMFSGAMAGVADEAETVAVLREFARAWGIRQLFLCVDPVICREIKNPGDIAPDAYPEEMLLLYGVRNGREYPSVLFRRKDLAPSLGEMRKNNVCLVFCPLYYRGRSLGYVAMDFGEATGSALYSVLMLLNGALMSLYLQNNIRHYADTIASLAVQDVMTGMLNRRGYREKAPAVFEQARKDGAVFAVMSADMDHMKAINDEHGHLMGDEAICRMGRGMQILQKMNLTTVHISGDEFLAYGMVDSPEDGGKLIKMVTDELERINREDPWICDISASFGVYAAVPREGEEIDSFLTRADRAMYADKNRKKHPSA